MFRTAASDASSAGRSTGCRLGRCEATAAFVAAVGMGVADSGRIDPQSYSRWTPATQALTSIEPKAAAQLYVNVKRLLDDAYRDLGHPNANFDDALVLAMQLLLSTPTPPGDPELLRGPDYFEHTDPALRALRPVQKEFLLLGPDNRRQVTAWMRAFASDLELKLN